MLPPTLFVSFDEDALVESTLGEEAQATSKMEAKIMANFFMVFSFYKKYRRLDSRLGRVKNVLVKCYANVRLINLFGWYEN